MLKKWFIAAIGKPNYVKYVTFGTDIYQSACVPFKAPGTEIIKRYLIPKDGTVLDIGANGGRFTTFATPLVGKGGKVYSFEPVAAAIKVLRQVVALRQLHQAVVVEAALSNHTGTANMTIPLKDGWKPQVAIAYIGKRAEPHTQQEAVRVEQLDAFCTTERIERIDFIKCDTEGHEYFVLAGGLNILKRDRPSIFCEIASSYLARYDLQPAILFDLLKTLGYRSYLPVPGGKLVAVDSYRYAADYFFLHPSKLTASLQEIIMEPEETRQLAGLTDATRHR